MYVSVFCVLLCELSKNDFNEFIRKLYHQQEATVCVDVFYI